MNQSITRIFNLIGKVLANHISRIVPTHDIAISDSIIL